MLRLFAPYIALSEDSTTLSVPPEWDKESQDAFLKLR
jgi:hypothetical protein